MKYYLGGFGAAACSEEMCGREGAGLIAISIIMYSMQIHCETVTAQRRLVA